MSGFTVTPVDQSSQSQQSQAYRPPQWAQPQLTSLTVRLPAEQAPILSDGSPNPDANQLTELTIFFDGVLRADHLQETRITEHPIQTGSSITDHAYSLPRRVALEVYMTDVLPAYQDGVFTLDVSKSVSCWKLLEQVKGLRTPITVTTRLEVYENFIIEDLRAEDTVRTRYGLRALVRLRELILGTTSTNTVSARKDQTNATNEGTKPTEKVPDSLNHLFDDMSKFPQPQWNSNTKP